MERSLRLLIVDDDALDRQELIRNCKQSGMLAEYFEAGSFVEARSLIAEHAIDCVLLDYAMPDTDGLSSLITLHEDYPYLPVIMVTGKGNEMLASDAIQAGAIHYFTKEVFRNASIADVILKGIEQQEAERKHDEQHRDLQHFAGVLAHDLKSPLASINQFSELMELDLAEGNHERLVQELQHTRKAASAMSALVKALSEYVEADQNRAFREVDLNQVMEQVRAMLYSLIDYNDCQLDCEPLPTVMGDDGLLVQLFQNLVANAMKFVNNVKPNIEISSQSVDGSCEIRVKDNGIGIAPEDCKRIFEPFTRLHTKRDYPGSGLGLATVARIVERHRGRIRVESQPGEGSTFIVTLPLAETGN